MSRLMMTVCWAGLCLLAGCKDQPSPFEQASRWTLETAQDKLTDQPVVQATAILEADPFKVQATVKCVGGKDLSYEFVAFNKDDTPAAADAIVLAPGEAGIPFVARIDGEEARNYVALGSRFNNQIIVNTSHEESIMDKLARSLAAGENSEASAIRFGKGDRLVIKMTLTSGDAMFDIDQTEAPLRQVLKSCSGLIHETISDSSASGAPISSEPTNNDYLEDLRNSDSETETNQFN